MKYISIIFIVLCFSVVTMAMDTVRVAAIQCPSIMGKTKDNLRNIRDLTLQAAAKGAKIVVLPECAVQGYMDPETWTCWSKTENGSNAVQNIAEKIPGLSTAFLAELARDAGVYLCVGMVEAGANEFYNAQILLDTKGKLVGHHRKKCLWTPGDSTWCSPGKYPVQVVETEFGRLGLMICYDFHYLPKKLAKLNADIVLYSVGWYGPNEKNWFSNQFPRKAVVPYGFDIIVANWASERLNQNWPGRGHSCIISGEGKVLSMANSVHGNEIVYADIEVAQSPPEVIDASPSGTSELPMVMTLNYESARDVSHMYLVQEPEETPISKESFILIYMHGMGGEEEQGMELFPELRAHLNEIGGIFVCPRDNEYTGLISDLINRYGKRKIYLSGASAGGRRAVWEANRHPERYSGLILMCPAVKRSQLILNLSDNPLPMPAWIVCGENDIMYAAASRWLTETLKKKKRAVFYNEIPGGDHNVPCKLINWNAALKFLCENSEEGILSPIKTATEKQKL